MIMSTTPSGQRVFGPEYGPEAIRQLTDGFSIAYSENGVLIEERPNGQRFAIRSELDGSATILYELERRWDPSPDDMKFQD